MPTETKNKKMIERLFESGAHFGFSKSRRHPSVVPHIYGTKNGSDIIDIEKTASALEEALELVKETAKAGKTILFVGTKDEVSRLVKEAAEKCEAPVVSNRWIGGMITNFSEIKKRIKRLQSLIADKESGELDKKYTKKERVMISREVQKLQFNFGGISTLERTPDMLIVVDPRNDEIPVREAKDAGIPVIGIMSSDCDISVVTHPIVVNDSLTASVKFVLSEIAEAIKVGKSEYKPRPTTSRRPIEK